MSLLSGSLSRLILLTFLFFAAWLDWKSGELPLYLPGAGAAAGAIVRFLAGSVQIPGFLLGFLPGLLLLALAFLTKQAVGYGDGAVFLAAGTFLGLEETVGLLVLSLLAAGAGGLVILLLKKGTKKEALPFVPFVLAGYVFLLVWI